MSDTIAAISTGQVVSAIGIVRLSGSEAVNAAERLFFPVSGKKLTEYEDRKLVYGKLCTAAGKMLDMCLCTVSHGPNSYTGEDTAEFQCHGSPVVLRTLLEELFALGVRQARAGEFTKRAFLNGRMDLTAAEAVADLISAESAFAAENAAGQLSGAISRKTEEIYNLLTDISSHFYAVLDYPDEDIEDFVAAKYAAELRGATAELKRLRDSYSRGRLMNAGIPAAIIGRPNAGKSSLLNALLGYERAIVTNVPGTTRDTIEEKLQLGNALLRLTDTAGIREAEDEAEKLGVQRSYAAAEQAELVICVMDGTDEAACADSELLMLAEKAENALVVATRQDLPGFDADRIQTRLKVMPFSAVTGYGLEQIEEAVNGMYPLPAVPAGEILTNARQAEAVATAVDYMEAAVAALEAGATPDIILTEAEGAMNAIGELSGRTVREDVTNRIFARFCVGK